MALMQRVQANGEKDVGSKGMLQVFGCGDLVTLQESKPTTFPSPKLTRAEKRSLIYPYYAGFSEAFVGSMLDRMGVMESSKVLDPWNGSGTTTLIASMRGACSTGYDLNPVLVIVARARAAKNQDMISAKEAWERLSPADEPGDTDPVEQCATLYERLVLPKTAQGQSLTPAADGLILCALFDTLRKSFQHAKILNLIDKS